MKIVHMVAYTLLLVGGFNWGLVGLFNFNLVTTIFGSLGLEQLVNVLVGASAVFVGYDHIQSGCKLCKGGK